MIIYKITNKINNKVYIGQTIRTVEERWSEHCKKTSDCMAIANAIQKYSKENFTIAVIDTANSIEELNKKEQAYIKKFNSLRPNGYNLTSGGLNFVRSQETKNRMSNHQLGKNNHNFGKKASAKTRAKMSKAHMGERNHFFGKTHTEETSKKLSEIMKLRGNLQLGRKRTKASKKRMSDAQKGRPAKNKKPIKCNENNIIYESITAAAKYLGVDASGICKHLKGNKKSCKGYTFYLWLASSP